MSSVLCRAHFLLDKIIARKSKILIAQYEYDSFGKTTVGRSLENLDGVSTVDADNYKLVFTIVEKLLSMGRKKILLLNSNKDYTISVDRTEAYLAALEQAKAEVDKKRIVYLENSTESMGKPVMEEFLQSDNPPDAVITSNEAVAHGVYSAAQEKQIKIGSELAVVSLGGVEVSEDQFSPRLSYAYQDYETIGKKSVDALINIIESPDPKYEHIEVKSKLVFDLSVGTAERNL